MAEYEKIALTIEKIQELKKIGFRRTSEENSKFVKTKRYTEYHCGKAVIKDKTKLSEAMEKLARLEDLEEQGKLKIKYEIPLLFDNF